MLCGCWVVASSCDSLQTAGTEEPAGSIVPMLHVHVQCEHIEAVRVLNCRLLHAQVCRFVFDVNRFALVWAGAPSMLWRSDHSTTQGRKPHSAWLLLWTVRVSSCSS